MVLCGIVCGFAFDIFRGIRRERKPGTGIIVIEDLFMWAVELVIVYAMAFRLNYAGVHGYEIIALVLGSVIYFMTVSRYAIRIVSKVYVFLLKAIKVVIAPVRIAIIYLMKPMVFLMGHIRRFARFYISSCEVAFSGLKTVVKAKCNSLGKRIVSKCQIRRNTQKNDFEPEETPN